MDIVTPSSRDGILNVETAWKFASQDFNSLDSSSVSKVEAILLANYVHISLLLEG